MQKSNLEITAAGCALIILFTASCSSFGSLRQSQPAWLADTINQADKFITAGEYKKTLDLYATAYEKHQNSALKEKYLEAGNRIRNAADLAFNEGDFSKAGRVYSLLLSDRVTRDFRKVLPFTPEYLEKRMDACVKSLTEMGLVKYREEKLQEAISIWEKVLAFDPDNRSVAKAVDTANRQLQRLMDMP